ncbi:ABC transporter ATP-binding protein [Eremococcus coleocola]|uniref:ABC transporter, ATP-binding protein n=1 Tax=Eremococcus coleocola ACS-139-V-Col8 TaxID=908337 RepID=E4KR81_9LACT|nr:ABC transporter ATP-binding protein [Eremococcus coleocola]EFR30539.1 ABC transporter, ATP-binding protein [Eremococcus coleocola ACS-139-V-Col8]
MEKVIEIKDLNKRYKDKLVLKNLSMTLYQGDIYGLIGKNGAGKTTLLKIITRLISDSGGIISLFGSQNTAQWSKALKRTGSVIETPVAYDQLTAEENLRYYAILRGMVDQEKVIAETLKYVNLYHARNQKFKTFSLGMKQKLGIAIAMLSKPDLLILDEPINGLDPLAIVEFRQLIRRLNQEFGISIIISSHILSELYQVATRFGFLNEGQLVREISKTDFDHLSEDFIILESNQIQAASQLIKDKLDLTFKVVNDHQLHIFGKTHHVHEIIVLLLNAGIQIDGIHYSRHNLEDYFTQLVQEKGAQA